MLGTMTGDGHLPVHEAYSPEACVPASLGSQGQSQPLPSLISPCSHCAQHLSPYFRYKAGFAQHVLANTDCPAETQPILS